MLGHGTVGDAGSYDGVVAVECEGCAVEHALLKVLRGDAERAFAYALGFDRHGLVDLVVERVVVYCGRCGADALELGGRVREGQSLDVYEPVCCVLLLRWQTLSERIVARVECLDVYCDPVVVARVIFERPREGDFAKEAHCLRSTFTEVCVGHNLSGDTRVLE